MKLNLSFITFVIHTTSYCRKKCFPLKTHLSPYTTRHLMSVSQLPHLTSAYEIKGILLPPNTTFSPSFLLLFLPSKWYRTSDWVSWTLSYLPSFLILFSYFRSYGGSKISCITMVYVSSLFYLFVNPPFLETGFQRKKFCRVVFYKQSIGSPL